MGILKSKKILMVFSDIPFPVNSGNRMRSLNFIQAFSDSNDVTLLCFGDDRKDVAAFDEARTYFNNVCVVNPYKNIKKTGFKERIIASLKCVPWEISACYSDEFQEYFIKLITEENFDIVFIRYANMAQYILKNKRNINSKVIVDIDDIEFVKRKRVLTIANFKNLYDKYRQIINNIILEKYYKKVSFLGTCIVCSNTDKTYLETEKYYKNVRVVPNSIDVEKYSIVKDYTETNCEDKVILICGSLSYLPNIDSVIWFVNEIFPLILKKDKNVKLQIVGLNPSSEINALANGTNILLYPNVDSVVPFYEKCSLVVVPLRIGGGTRIKILESFACKRPVVSTNIGGEGLELIDKKHCVLTDSPTKFALECSELLGDYAYARRLTENAYEFVKTKYDIASAKEVIKSLLDE